MHVEHRNGDRPGGAQPRNRARVFGGHPAAPALEAGRPGHPLHGDVVLHAEQNAVERAAPAAGGGAGIGGIRGGAGARGVERRDDAELGVARLDARERRLQPVARLHGFSPWSARR